MSISCNTGLACNCKIFVDILMKELFSSMSEHLILKLHEMFECHFSCGSTQPDFFPSIVLPTVFNDGIDRTTFLINIMSFISPCFESCGVFLKHLEMMVYPRILPKLADFRILSDVAGNSPPFRKCLLHMDLVSTLPEDELTLMEGTSRIIYKVINTIGYSVFEPSRVKDIVKSAYNVFFRDNSIDGLRRIFLVSVGILAAHLRRRNEEGIADECVHFLRMYFTVTRDPLVTINEVRKLLYACLISSEKLRLFQPLCEEFMNAMPECPARIQHRKLTDLARIQIRQNLKKSNVALPVAVTNLPLPDWLKKFVLGDTLDFSQRSGNALEEQIITRVQLSEMLFERRI